MAWARNRPPAVLASLEAGDVTGHHVLAEALGGCQTAVHGVKALMTCWEPASSTGILSTLLDGSEAGPAFVLADGAGSAAFRWVLAGAGKELFDGIDGRAVHCLPLLGDELVGAVVGGVWVVAPFPVQLVALPFCLASEPVLPDFPLWIFHAEKRTRNDAEAYTDVMLKSMLKTMTNTAEHSSKCLRCGRTLRVSTGYGPTCLRKIRAAAIDAALEGFTPAQRDKAAELISDGGLVPTSRPGVYRATSSSGDVTYMVHSAVCGCPAGLHGRDCYHVLAVRVIEAVAATSRKAA